jgi:DNA-binding transcriptional LysR family regulator
MTFGSRVSLHKLEVFDTVVRHASITRAAEELFVAQPVVSAHVRSLEERLGVKLFDRRGRQIELTEGGRIVHEWATELLTRTRELSREIDGLADGTRGGVVLAASMTAGAYLLPPIVIAFKRDHPDADISLNITEPEGVLTAAEGGECDFGVVMLDDSDSRRPLNYRHLRDEDLVLVAAPEGPPAASVVTTADLAYLSFVCSPLDRRRRRMIDRLLARHGVLKRHVVLSLGHASAIKHAVREGLGVAMMFRASVESELRNGELREIAVSDAVLSTPLLMVHRRDKRLSPLQSRLADAIVAELGRHSGDGSGGRPVAD